MEDNNSTLQNGVSKLIKQIKASNQRKQIKLRVRPTDSKGYSLFLDVWNEGKRQYEFLKMYFYGKISTAIQDKETIRLYGNKICAPKRYDR